MCGDEGGCAAGMVRMPMRDKQTLEPRPMPIQFGREIGKMPGVADASVEERRAPIRSDQQVRVVPVTGHRTGIVSLEQDGIEHVFSVAGGGLAPDLKGRAYIGLETITDREHRV
jgi:hypothetical protein